MTEKEMVDQAMGVAWLVKKHGAEINILKAQLAERDKTILEQQAKIKAVRSLVAGDAFPNWENTVRTGHTRGRILDLTEQDFTALEAALKAERIKTLEDAAKYFVDIDSGMFAGFDVAITLDRMANELKEQP